MQVNAKLSLTKYAINLRQQHCKPTPGRTSISSADRPLSSKRYSGRSLPHMAGTQTCHVSWAPLPLLGTWDGHAGRRGWSVNCALIIPALNEARGIFSLVSQLFPAAVAGEQADQTDLQNNCRWAAEWTEVSCVALQAEVAAETCFPDKVWWEGWLE